jgi:hypothetical protein
MEAAVAVQNTQVKNRLYTLSVLIPILKRLNAHKIPWLAMLVSTLPVREWKKRMPKRPEKRTVQMDVNSAKWAMSTSDLFGAPARP